MRIETVSLIISVFVSGSFAIAALIRNWKNALCVKFAVFCSLLFAHDVLALLEKLSGYGSPIFHLALTLSLGPSMLFLLEEVGPGFGKFIRKAVAAYIPLSVFFILLLSFKTPSDVEQKLLFLAHVLLLLPAVGWLFLLSRLEARTSLTRERLRLRYLTWGGVFVLAIYLTNALHYALEVAVPPLGTLALSLYLFFLFQTLIQKELMTSEELLTKTALFGSIAVMLTVIYSLLLAWVSDEHGLFYFNTFIASFVVIVLFDPMRKMASKVVRKIFLERNLILENELDELSKALVGVLDPNDIFLKVHGMLERGLGVANSALYLLERDGLSYAKIGARGAAFPAEVAASNLLIEYMGLRKGRPFVLETIENDKASFYSAQHQKFCDACLETMRNLPADFVVPFIYEGKVIGFSAVKTGERIALSNEQLRLFLPLSRQLAQILKSTQTFNFLRDRDKLAAVGEMAAGLAHEIKNPLGAIKGAAELLKDQKDNPEFLKIITDEVDRLSTVLSNFLDYARPRRNDANAVTNPQKIVEHTAQLAMRDSRVQFELDCDTSKEVSIDPEALKQVLLNLFLNAIQAMEEVPNPKLSVRLREIRPRSLFNLDSLPLFKVWEGWRLSKEKHEPYMEIVVSDTGKGIDPTERERIFTPFYTTKARGTGLGLAICQRLIEGMGGTISVKPNSPNGTTFILHIPIRPKENLSTVGLTEALT